MTAWKDKPRQTGDAMADDKGFKLGRNKNIEIISEPPSGWSKLEGVSSLYRSGSFFSWVSGFAPPRWIREPGFLTIMPNETVEQALERVGLSKSGLFVFYVDV
jgi:hypothetical protein